MNILLKKNKFTLTSLIFLINLFLGSFNCFAQPANDDCSGAVILTQSTSCNSISGNVNNATQSIPAKQSFGTADDDVWYKFIATKNSVVISVKGSSSFNVVFELFSGTSCTNLTSINATDDLSTNGSTETSAIGNLVIGNTYWIRVYHYSSIKPSSKTFDICITDAATKPSCNNSLKAGNTCGQSLPMCDFNGYCGNTKKYNANSAPDGYTADYWPELYDPNGVVTDAFCGSIENNSFITFLAANDTINFNIWIYNSKSNLGIQLMVCSIPTCGSGPVTKYYCNNQLNPTTSSGYKIISVNGLVPGNTYYIMIDGYGGDECDYTVGLPPNSGFAVSTSVTPTSKNICLGSSIDLTGAGGDGINYSWSTSANAADLSSTNTYHTIATPTTLGTKTYTVVSNGTALPSCTLTNSATATINVVSPPTIDPLVTPPTICFGATATLTANPTGGKWSSNTPFVANINENTGIITASSAGSTIITYTLDSGCEASVVSNPITILPEIKFTITLTKPDDCITPNGKIKFSNLIALTNYSCVYKINGTTISVPLNFTTDINGTYEITNLNTGVYSNFIITMISSGCSGTDLNSYNLSYAPLTFSLAGKDSPTCASPQGKIIISGLKPNTIGYTLDYSPTDSKVLTADAFGKDSIINLSPGTYSNFLIKLSNCSGSNGAQIIIKNPETPVVQFRDTLLCAGESVTIKAKVTDPSVGIFNWKEFPTNTSDSIVVHPILDTTYTLTSYSLFDCPSITYQSFVKVYIKPVPTLTTNVTEECEKVKVNFSNTSNPNGLNGIWDFGDGIRMNSIDPTISHAYLKSGLKDIKLVLSNPACKDSITYKGLININPNSKAIITADKLTTIVTDSKFTFTNSSLNSTDYIWDFGDDEYSNDSSNIVKHSYLEIPGKYEVKLYASSNGKCPDSTFITIKITEDLIFYIPNSFTPNGDEHNPTFLPIFTSGFESKSYNLKIYNKWGHIIFTTNDVNSGWDGKIKGLAATNDIYNWVVEFYDSQTQLPHIEKGYVTLLR